MADSAGGVDAVSSKPSIQDIASKYQIDTDPTKWSADDWKKLDPKERQEVMQLIEDMINQGAMNPDDGHKAEETGKAADNTADDAKRDDQKKDDRKSEDHASQQS